MSAPPPNPHGAHAEAVDALLDYVAAVQAVRAVVADAESRGQSRASVILLRAALAPADKHRKDRRS